MGEASKEASDIARRFFSSSDTHLGLIGEELALAIDAHTASKDAEIEQLRGIIAAHDMCHDMHGKVGVREFADGCAAEQRKHYGCAPDADEVTRLREQIERWKREAMAARRYLYPYKNSNTDKWIGVAYSNADPGELHGFSAEYGAARAANGATP